jgi:hypothetical protein
MATVIPIKPRIILEYVKQEMFYRKIMEGRLTWEGLKELCDETKKKGSRKMGILANKKG